MNPIIDGWDAVRIYAEGFGLALKNWWYVWLLMGAVGVGLRLLNDWSKRVTPRRTRRRR